MQQILGLKIASDQTLNMPNSATWQTKKITSFWSWGIPT
jgi:hypothetical protein